MKANKTRASVSPWLWAAALVVGALLLAALGPGAPSPGEKFFPVESGKIADRDIVAEREISFVDEKATRLRVEAEERLVLPIFVLDEKPARRALENLRRFKALVDSLASRSLADQTLYLSVQSEFPGLLSRAEALQLVRSPYREQSLVQADSLLALLLDQGIAAMPTSGLEPYNGDYAELRRLKDGRPQSEEIPLERLVTLKSLGAAINAEVAKRRLPAPISSHASLVLRAFAAENVFFDAAQSGKRLEAARAGVQPVLRTIAKGERIVRTGSLVSEADAATIAQARLAQARLDWGRFAGSFGILVAAAALGLFISSRDLSGIAFRPKTELLFRVFAALFFAIALLVYRFGGLGPSQADPLAALGLALALPTALFAIIASVLAGPRLALLYSLVLALLTQSAAGLDIRLFLFCFFSGGAAAFLARSAQSRIELVRAGALLALCCGLVAALLALSDAESLLRILSLAGWGAANGFACALLALALLPVLEQLLNAPTRFRLLELSDLNAPILKRLLTAAPGTYSHSVTVAHLAESAAREIGADPLVARVGGYYHDIGKIEQPEYFVENQAGYNKHQEISPRLSATVIRSHVKIGAEKTRALGLPEEIVAIVAQHHGNALIAWFYEAARKEEGGEVDADDFSYPGQPPASREAAIVMLADAVEASTRTLKKPTMSRLEDFIRTIIMDKVSQGQLDRCDLTFRDLETIRGSFTRILAGHFHSRIEYPRIREPVK